MEPRRLAAFVDNLQGSGRYCFAKSEPQSSLGLSKAALKIALNRLVKSNRLVAVRRGFYVIVPLEYAARGILPPEWFIADLAGYLGKSYYVGLLTAAALHGAAHQQPQEFQVVLPEALRDITVKDLRIRFFKKARIENTPLVDIKTPTGNIRVSSPAATALDLVSYAKRIGGLARAFSLLEQLIDSIDASSILEAASASAQLAPVQRVGWLLEHLGRKDLVEELASWLNNQKPRTVSLAAGNPSKGCRRNKKWAVIVNTEIGNEH